MRHRFLLPEETPPIKKWRFDSPNPANAHCHLRRRREPELCVGVNERFDSLFFVELLKDRVGKPPQSTSSEIRSSPSLANLLRDTDQ
jgi:hypothetical protein